MQFKRWRLSVASPLVNAGLGLSLLFTAASCTKSAENSPNQAETAQAHTDLSFPTVWETRPLDDDVKAIALSDGLSALTAVAFDSGGLQLFTMDGDKLAEPANFKLKDIATGNNSVVDDTMLTIFPAVTDSGELKAFIYGDGLMAPAIVDLPVNEERQIEGLCATPLHGDNLLRVSYWTSLGKQTLKTGRITIKNGELDWANEDAADTDFNIQSCAYIDGQAVPLPDAADASGLERGDLRSLVTLDTDGDLRLSYDNGQSHKLVQLRGGVTTDPPKQRHAIAAGGVMQAGGFPGGVIVLAGTNEENQSVLVYVDPSAITLGTN